MSTLGEILECLQDPAEIHRLVAESGDLAVIARIAQGGEDPCALALQAVDAFTRGADDEAWVKLIGRIQDADMPAAACLGEMLGWALTR